MLTIKHFRIRVVATGEWVIGPGEFGCTTTPKRTDGLIFEPDEWEKWEDDQDYEIVPLTETEIMERLGPEIAPRLPGF
jgi:hypothetical protein